ncbi:MAG: carboxypeptidase-like regulatory domain-containing protein, partial [Rikenellaceae bacterium]
MAFTQKSYAGDIISTNGAPIEQTIKEQAVSINLKNQPLKNILYEIQKQSGISFAFNENEFSKELSNMSLQVKNMSVEKALNQLLASTGYTYKVVGNAITIVKRPESQKPVTKFALNGKVIDGSTKRPVVGATVLVLGTTTGAITDDKGAYSINITVGQTIEVSFVGMKTFIKKIESEMKEFNITLEPDQMSIDNVVITGYGSFNKQSFTGNTTMVKGE